MKTHAVVITFNPDRGPEGSFKEFDRVWIIDNGSTKVPKYSGAKTIALGTNMGIAHAQNAGLTAAFEAGADGVVLFDHDSTPQKNFVKNLWAQYSPLNIVGANIYDINTKKTSRYPVRQGLFFTRKDCASSTRLEDTMMCIASGTLITRAVYEKVGPMRADYFIDYVDWEFCLRAYHVHGIQTVIARDAVLHHARGMRQPRRFLGFTIHPPGYSEMRIKFIFQNRARTLRKFILKDRAFFAFESMALVRDFLLLFFESRPLNKAILAMRSWLYGLLKS